MVYILGWSAAIRKINGKETKDRNIRYKIDTKDRNRNNESEMEQRKITVSEIIKGMRRKINRSDNGQI